MKIYLENFKCYTKREFDLGENGITLIKGMSGIGKSSILDSIYFALYGKGMKILKHGTKSCKVIFSISDITITRTKGPLRLVYQKGETIHEDKAAQAVIDEMFGKNYEGTGYMKQNDNQSFILLPPTDKLVFIEQYAFLGIDMSTYKEHIKEVRQKRDTKLTSISSQLQLTSDVLGEKEEPEYVNPPSTTDKKLIKKRVQQTQTDISNEKMRIESLNKSHTAFLSLQTYTQTTNTQIQELQHNNKNCNMTQQEKEKETLTQSLTQLKDELKTYLRDRRYMNDAYQLQLDKNRYTEMYQKELDSLVDTQTSLQNTVWADHTKEECIEKINRYNDYKRDKISYKKNVASLEKKTHTDVHIIDTQIQELRHKIQNAEISSHTYTCPKCDTKLCIVKHSLKSCEDKEVMPKKEFNDATSALQTLTSKRDKALATNRRIEELQQAINTFKDTYKTVPDNVSSYYEEHLQLETKLEQVSDKINRKDILVGMKKELDDRENNIHTIDNFKEIDEEDTRSRINTINADITRINVNIKQYKDISCQIKRLETNIQTKKELFIKKYGEISGEEEIQKDISDAKKNVVVLEEMLDKHRNDQLQLEKYTTYKSEYADYKEWCEKYDELSKKEIDMSNKVCSINILRDTLADAESIAVGNVINRIQDMVQDYLDVFFVDDGMTITLKTFKEDKKKKTKAQINVEISYKGMDCTISMLSGGELQRLMLAFNLGISDMYNLPFIMLDETMSNLDEDTTQTIVDGIKEKCKDKLVIIIAHQVVSGVFDKTIDVQ